MPRPKQRRGADAKRTEKQAKREKEEEHARAVEAAATRERYRKKEMPYAHLKVNAFPSNTRAHADAKEEGDADVSDEQDQEQDDEEELPALEPDVKSYFQQIYQQLQSLPSSSSNSHAASSKIANTNGSSNGAAKNGLGLDEGDEDEEGSEEDPRQLLLHSTLSALSTHELALAGDADTSPILEALLPSLGHFSKRVLADRFCGNYEQLVRHRFAGHCVQTLLLLAGEVVHSEVQGIISHPTAGSSSTPSATSSSSSALPSMTTLILSVVEELKPHVPTLIYDPFASHSLRTLLLLLAGKLPARTEGGSGVMGIGKGKGVARSKKSLLWRARQPLLDQPSSSSSSSSHHHHHHPSSTSSSAADAGSKEDYYLTPPSFAAASEALLEMLLQLDNDPSAPAPDASSEADISLSVPLSQPLSRFSARMGEGVRRAAMDVVAGPVIRVLVELEAAQGGGWRAGGWADRLLAGLIDELASASASGDEVYEDEVNEDEDEDGEDRDEVKAKRAGRKEQKQQLEQRRTNRLEYLTTFLRTPSSSPTFEAILTLAPSALFNQLWTSLFAGKLHRIAGHAVGNFVLAGAVARLGPEQLREAVSELEAVGRERRGEWVDNCRVGVLAALLTRAAALETAEEQVVEMILDTFQIDLPSSAPSRITVVPSSSIAPPSAAAGGEVEEEATPTSMLPFLIPCILSLNRYQYFKKLPANLTDVPTMQGSLLIQHWLRGGKAEVIREAILTLPIASLIQISASPIASHILSAFLSSPRTPAADLRAFLMRLCGHYHTLADSKLGSRIAEECWARADVFLKDRIARSLAGSAAPSTFSTAASGAASEEPSQARFLQASAYGHFFARLVELPLWIRRREEWKLKMGAGGGQHGAAAVDAEARRRKKEKNAKRRERNATAAEAGEEAGGKKRERERDEIDELFDAAGGAPRRRM